MREPNFISDCQCYCCQTICGVADYTDVDLLVAIEPRIDVAHREIVDFASVEC